MENTLKEKKSNKSAQELKIDNEKILKNLMCFLVINKVSGSPVEESKENLEKIQKNVLCEKKQKVFDFKERGGKGNDFVKFAKGKGKKAKGCGQLKIPGGRR